VYLHHNATSSFASRDFLPKFIEDEGGESGSCSFGARELSSRGASFSPIGTIEGRQSEVGRQTSSSTNPRGASRHREDWSGDNFRQAIIYVHGHSSGNVTNSYEKDEATISRQLQLYSSP